MAHSFAQPTAVKSRHFPRLRDACSMPLKPSLLSLCLLLLTGISRCDQAFALRYSRRRHYRLQGRPMATEDRPLLALPGPSFPQIDFRPENVAQYSGRNEEGTFIPGQSDGVANRLMVGGKKIFLDLEQRGSEVECHEVKTAHSVWDCSIVLVKYLERAVAEKRLDLASKRIIELGAGTGLVGIAASALVRTFGGSEVPLVITDVAEVVPQITRNIAVNYPEGVPEGLRAASLDWLHRERDVPALDGPYDIVLAADVVWVTSLIEPFVRSLEAVTRPGSLVFFGYQSRSRRADELLWSLLEANFTREEAALVEYDPVYRQPGKIEVFTLERIH